MVKAIVCSIPKSGTYLLGAILTQLGLDDTKQHVNQRGYTDYRTVDLDTARSKPSDLWVDEPLEAILQRIGPGQFVLSHLPATAAPLLGDFQVIFAYRNVRDILVSFCRWTADTGRWPDDGRWRTLPDGPDKLLGFLRTHGKKVRGTIAATSSWIAEPRAVHVSFEELMGDSGEAAALDAMRRIARALGARDFTDAALLDHLARAKQTQTITRSAGRSIRADFWCAAVEREFVRRGFAAVNARLGFHEPSAGSLWGRWWAIRYTASQFRRARRSAA